MVLLAMAAFQSILHPRGTELGGSGAVSVGAEPPAPLPPAKGSGH